jgi:hypothetical protein
VRERKRDCEQKDSERERARERGRDRDRESAHARTCICVRVCGDGGVCVFGGGGLRVPCGCMWKGGRSTDSDRVERLSLSRFLFYLKSE